SCCREFCGCVADSEDGLGVRNSYENDEIESVESLTVSFSETVLISDVFLTDLFIEDPLLGRPYAEVGYYTVAAARQRAAVDGSPPLYPPRSESDPSG